MAEAVALQEQIGRLFAETMNVQAPAADTDLFATAALDSLGFVDLLARLESEFGIRISVEDIDVENFRCIEKIAEFVAKRVERGAQTN